MPQEWTLKLVADLEKSVERRAKTIELRLQTETNRWLIDQMLQYQPGDRLTLQFPQKKIPTIIQTPTIEKQLKNLTANELKSVVGFLPIHTIKNLVATLRQLYHMQSITDNTTAYLAHFTVQQ